jgi:MFS family permease
LSAQQAAAVPRAVSALVLSFVPLFLGIGFLQIVLGAWLVTVGFTAEQAGALISIEGVTMIVTSVPLGIVSDVYGRKHLLVLSGLANAAGLLAFSLTADFWLLVPIAMVLGFADGAGVSTWNALLADMTTVANRNKAFSLSFVMANVTTGVGLVLPGVFPFLVGPLGVTSYAIHRDALFLLGAASFLTPASVFLILRKHPERREPGRKWAGVKNKATLAKFGFVAGSIGFGAGFIIPLIGSWFYFRFGVSDSLSGPILAFSNILIGFSAVASPRLAMRFGQLRAILLTTGSSMLFMLAMAFVPLFGLAAGVYVVRAALMNMSGPLMDSFSMSIFPADQRGVVSAMNNLMFRLPNSVSTYFGGVMLGMGLLQLPFFVASALYTLGLGGFYTFFVASGRYPRHPVSSPPDAGEARV